MADLTWAGFDARTLFQHDSTIKEGTAVIADQNGERKTFVIVKPGGTLKIGKQVCKLDPVLGAPFGSKFEVGEGGKLHRTTYEKVTAIDAEEAPTAAPEQDLNEEQRDNRNLLDSDSSQKMGEHEINEMRASGSTGADIVKALISNSTTFASKTSFSQEKYIKKKKRKYCIEVTFRRPCGKTLCEAAHFKTPARLHGLRPDTLGVMLTTANIGAHSRILVMDDTGGLVTGAVAERMGGLGMVCLTHSSPRGGRASLPPSDLLRFFNFTSEQLRAVVSAPLTLLHHHHRQANNLIDQQDDKAGEACKGGLDEKAQEEEAKAEVVKEEEMADEGKNEEKMVEGKNEETAVEGKNEDLAGKGARGGGAGGNPSGKVRRASDEELEAVMKHGGFSGLILASPLISPTSALQVLLPLLRPSAPFAVYSPWLQPLTAAMDSMCHSKQAIAMQLVEPWFREHQVLPSRTHPMMSMHGTGGYVLTGTVVVAQSTSVSSSAGVLEEPATKKIRVE